MQYWQRKLQRSVTETRRSEIRRAVAVDERLAAPPAEAYPPAVDLPAMEIGAPTRGNRKLEALLAAANADERLHAWWHMQQVNAERLGMSDHSWVHVRIVLNIALRLFRLLGRAGRRAGDGGRRTGWARATPRW